MKLVNFLSLILIGILFFLIFSSWIVSPIISAGDSWYYFSSMFNNHYLFPYSWYTQATSTGLGGQGFAYVNTYIVVALVLEIAKIFHMGWETTVRLFVYIGFLVISLSSSIFLIKKLFPEIKFWVFTPLIFIFNSYVLMLVGGGQIITALSYSLIPFSLYLFIEILDFRPDKIKIPLDRILILSLIFFTQCLLDLRIAFVEAVAVLIYLFVNAVLGEFKLKNFLFIFTSILLVAMMSAYWLIPILLYGIDPIQQLGVNYSSSEMVKFLSFAKIENSIGLMHPYWPENIFGKVGFMKLEFLIIPILAFSSILFIDKRIKEKKIILYFLLLALIGIFLGKGASEPFGNFYIWLFENIPGMQLFRDSFKWYVLIALSYSILIPFSIEKIYTWIKNNKNIPLFSKILNFQNVFLIFVLFYFIILLAPALFGNLNGTFKLRKLPEEYVLLDKYLSSDKSYFRTIWIPNTMLFGHYTNEHPQISGRDFFGEYVHKDLIGVLGNPSTKRILEEASVKYVIIPSDTENEIYLTDRGYDDKKYQAVVMGLDSIPWLEKVKEFGKIIVYKTINYEDHFWCDCDAKITFEYINPTEYKVLVNNSKKGDKIVFSEAFDNKWVAKSQGLVIPSSKFSGKYNSFVIPNDGDYNFRINYIPQKIVNIGAILSVTTIIGIIIIISAILVKKRLK